MARRDLSTVQQAQVVAQPHPEGALGGIADIGLKLIDASQQAKINENASKAQLDLATLDNQYQIDSQSDPFNKEKLTDYQTKRQDILNAYKSDISPIYRMQWDESARRLTANSDTQLEAWRFKQAAVNTTNSIKTSMENNFLQANKAGVAYGSGSGDDLSHLMDFAVSQKQLTDFAAKNLGQESAQQLLKDYHKDYFKSFIMGAAQTNPARADELLKKPEISSIFDTKETEELQDVMRRTIKQKDIQTLAAQSANESQATNIVYGDGDYFSKRLQIDKMELSGQISSEAAGQARRVLRSTKAVTDLSKSPVMSDIVNRMYDLNAIQETDSAGYLQGVKALRQEILSRQADGELSPSDALKLNNRLDGLSAQKTAAATQRVGIDFYDAKEKFNQLAPQYRGEAIRELFYRTDGKNLSAPQMAQQANAIVDEMKGRARQATVAKLQKFDAGTYPPPLESPKPGEKRTPLEPPLAFDREAFMKKHNITPEKLAAKAKASGMSENAVLVQFYQATGGK